MAIKKKYLKVLREINATIPKELLDNLMIKEKETPNMEWVVNKAMKDPKMSKEKKAKLQNMIDAGIFGKEVEVQDEEKLKEIQDYVNEEIERAIRLGRLPEDRELLVTKSKQYVKRNKKSI